MRTHALLSPSAAGRWLECTPSARMEDKFPNTSSVYADEGTLAHRYGELLIRYHLKELNEAQLSKEEKEIQANPLYQDEMYSYAYDYALYVLETYHELKKTTKDAVLILEQKVNLTEWVEGGYGHADAIIIADGMMTVIDLKYGKGVSVSAHSNKQGMLYALGALYEFAHLYDITDVRMTIYQPRIDNISSYELPAAELLHWAETVLKPRAALAYAGEGSFSPGDACLFCRAKAVCKANADYNLEIAKHDFADATLLTDADVSDILDRASRFTKWIEAVQQHALKEAVTNGKKWPGYKLVEGRSNRTYTDEQAVADKLHAAMYTDDQLYTQKLIGITAMEKLLGKKDFPILLGDLVIKPSGKPTLAPESDKRPELNSAQAAAADFAEYIED